MKYQKIKGSESFRLTVGDDVENVVIPDQHEGMPVVEIGIKAFYDFKNLKSIKIPSSIKVIGEKCFYQAKNLERIQLSEGLERIEEFGLAYTNVKKLIIPSSTKFIGKFALFFNQQLIEITLPEGLTELSENVLSYCDNLKSIHIPSTVQHIRSLAFFDCAKITSIKVPPFVKVIEEGAFSCCSSLKEVILPEGLEAIQKEAFRLTDLKEVKLPDSLKFLGESAFSNAKLKMISIPTNIKILPAKVFSGNHLKIVELPEGLEEIGMKAFQFNWNLTAITIPKTVKEIGNLAFLWNKKLKNVMLLNPSTKIGNGAFSHTGFDPKAKPKKKKALKTKPIARSTTIWNEDESEEGLIEENRSSTNKKASHSNHSKLMEDLAENPFLWIELTPQERKTVGTEVLYQAYSDIDNYGKGNDFYGLGGDYWADELSNFDQVSSSLTYEDAVADDKYMKEYEMNSVLQTMVLPLVYLLRGEVPDPSMFKYFKKYCFPKLDTDKDHEKYLSKLEDDQEGRFRFLIYLVALHPNEIFNNKRQLPYLFDDYPQD